MIKQLESSTVRKINSGQVITDMKSVVKELVENSLDAGADYIDIRLEDSGFGSITVADNGSGISRKDRSLCALGHHTSKIVDLSSLESLASYGFRGEALHSICECATSVQITTMTSSEKSATTVTYSHTGTPDSTKSAPAISAVPLTAHTHGTTIVASGLWGSHPVRKEYLRSLTKTEARKIQEMMLSYALIRPDVRFVLKNPPAKIFVSGPCSDVGQSVLTNYGPLLFETLQKVEFSTETVKIEGFLPSKNAEKSIALRKTNDRCFIYINSRPVDFPKVSKMVNSSVRKWFEVDDSKSYPFTLLNFVLEPNLYDINLTPDKRKVLFTNDDDVLKAVSDMLIELYPLRSIDEKETDDDDDGGDDCGIFKPSKRQKREKSDNDDNNGSLYSTQLTDFFKKQRPKASQEQIVTEEGSLDNEDIVFDTTSTQKQLTKRRRNNSNNDEGGECEDEDSEILPPKKRSPSSEKKKAGKRDFERFGAVSEDVSVSINPEIIAQAQLGITSSSPRNSVIRIKHNPITLDSDRYWVPTSADNAEIVGITKIGSLQKAFWTFLVFQDLTKPLSFQRVSQNRSHSFDTQSPHSLTSSSSSGSSSSGSSQSSVDSSPSKPVGSGISTAPKMFMLSWERAEEACHAIRELRRALYPSDPVAGTPLRIREEDISDSVAWRLLYQHSKRTTDALTLNSFKVVSDDDSKDGGDDTPSVRVVEVPRGIEYKDVAGEIKDVLKQLLRGTKLPICKYVGKALLARAPMKGLSGPPTPEAGLALLREVVSGRISSCPHGKRLFQLLANYQIK